MKQTVSLIDFERAFRDFGRSDNFSSAGLMSLFEYLEEYEDSTGEEMELDVIALCCSFTEYEDLKELQANYDSIDSMEDLENHTTVIYIPNSDGFIIQDF